MGLQHPALFNESRVRTGHMVIALLKAPGAEGGIARDIS
jgi:hypothetical protein